MKKLADAKWVADNNILKESPKEESDCILSMDPVRSQQQQSNINKNLTDFKTKHSE